MSKIFIICICLILTIFFSSWEIALISNKDKLNNTAQAIPDIRFEYVDKSRNALIIDLFNPGDQKIEINHTALFYRNENNMTTEQKSIKNYGNKPLVLDSGDTIIIPLSLSMNLDQKGGSYWAVLDFSIFNSADFFSLHHKLRSTLFNDFN